MHTPTFIIALFIIANGWEQPNCPLTEEWMNKMKHVDTVEYDPTLKRKLILTQATTWVSQKTICSVI